jgi:hypothetical protein
LYTRSAFARQTLFTGGKSIAGDLSLFTLAVSATEVTNTRATPPFGYDFALTNIPPSCLTVGGRQVGEDGRSYIVLPDGEGVDDSVSAPGYPYYVFNVESAKETPRIAASSEGGGATLDPDKVVDGARFCVGQRLIFNVAWDATPPAIQTNTFKWSFTGTFVNDWTQPSAMGSKDYSNNPSLLSNEVQTNWWTSGAYSPPASYQADVTVVTVFTNGQSATNPLTGLFSIHKPQLYGFQNRYPLGTSNYADPAGVVYTNYQTQEPFLVVSPGGGFRGYIHSKFAGEAGITQLLNGSGSNGFGAVTTTNTYQADNDEFFTTVAWNPTGLMPVLVDADGTLTNNFLFMSDSPSINCKNNTGFHWDFIDYIRFKPGGTHSIFVTLGIVKWHIYTTAVLSNGDYVVTSSDGTNDTMWTLTNAFPIWSFVRTNIGH